MKYYKVTIEIYTDFDPTGCSIETLAQDATSGDSICHTQKVKAIEYKKLPWQIKNFFGEPDEKNG